MSDIVRLTDDKGRVNLTDLITEVTKDFLRENQAEIIKRAQERLKKLKQELRRNAKLS